jgi:DedD protein
MDRRVKERLIGASILVALIVLVVPELLSGPKLAAPVLPPGIAPEPIRNVTVDLATSKAPAVAEVEAAPAPVPVPVPVPIAAPPSVAAPVPAPAAAVAVETPQSSPISGPRGSWAVQLGSFASRANADNLLHQLKTQGFSVYILSGGAGTAARYKVRVGPLADRESADRTTAKLKSLGHVSSIVAPAT